MTQFFHKSLLISVGVAALALSSAACSSSSGGDDDSSSGGTGGTGSMAPCNPGANGNVVLTIDPTGWMDTGDACNADVGVHGAWYSYGDAYDVAKCTEFGMHMASECATITSPPPGEPFPNTGGAMRTTGHVEQVLPCVAGSMATSLGTSGCPGGNMPGGSDYSSMWGAGIGLELAATGGDNSVKTPWDATAHGVVGIRFFIDQVPPAGLRVEFPMQLTAEEAANDTPVAVTTMPPTTDDHSKGAPFWGAQANGDKGWPNSPVMANQANTVLFADVAPAELGHYTFDLARLLGVQFHVPTKTAPGSDYDFTISKLELIRDPNQP
jgi:hypothetical protein